MKTPLWFCILVTCFTCALSAEEPSVVASLSSGNVEVGEDLILEVRVTGSRKAETPEAPQVDGLEIAYVGQNQQMQTQIINGSVSSSTSLIFNFSVIPQKSGRFTIGPVKVSVGDKVYKTEPLALTVGGDDSGVQDSPIAFAEIVAPKTELYLGEAIPVEMRFYLDAQIRGELEQAPTLTAEGFTMLKLDKPVQNQVTRNGKTYNTVTFKVAVTPVKTGKLTLGPSKMNGLVQLQSKKRRTPPGFGGFPNFDDFFASQMQPPRRISLQGAPLEVEIKPLPSGAPEGFAGAVGQFELSSEASPLSVKLGDPVTLKMKISGRGNFDRVAAPRLDHAQGWKTYPASSKIEPNDDLGISGTKNFEMALVPETATDHLPELSFAYFDPVAQSYKVLKTVPLAIVVSPNGSISNAPASTPVPTAQPTPDAVDILHIQDELGVSNRTFAPLSSKSGFWAFQAVPGISLIAFIAYSVVRGRSSRTTETDQLHSQQKRALQIIAKAQGQVEFYDAALEWIRCHAARLSQRQPATLDADEICALLVLDATQSMAVRQIFEMAAGLRYSGSGGAGAVSDQDRADVLKTVKALEVSHASR